MCFSYVGDVCFGWKARNKCVRKYEMVNEQNCRTQISTSNILLTVIFLRRIRKQKIRQTTQLHCNNLITFLSREKNVLQPSNNVFDFVSERGRTLLTNGETKRIFSVKLDPFSIMNTRNTTRKQAGATD